MSVPDDQVLTLQVANMRPQDAGASIARLSATAMNKVGVREGDLIELIGKRHTAAIAMQPYPDDEGLNIVRLDGLQRVNAGATSGDHIEVRKVEARAAAKVVLAPAQKNLVLQGSGEALQRTFLHRPMVAGDVISTSVQQRASGRDPRDQALRNLLDLPAYGLQEIRLVVVSTQPRGIVQMTEQTVVELRPQFEEPKEARRADVTYDDIGGLGSSVDQVREMVELPLRHPELFQRLGIDPPKGVLLYGPPGTGKTLLARAVANETEANFYHIAGPEIMGSRYGESEERLRQVFQEASQNAPSIIFIDEIDSIAPKREQVTGEVERRIVAQLLTLMDGLEPRQNIVVIGATNRRDAIDEALRRPGRFDREIVIGVPDQNGRREVLAIHTRGMPLAENTDMDEIARTTYGFVGADLGALVREAAMDALRRVLPDINLRDGIPAEVLERLTVSQDDFMSAMKRIQPSALREIMIQAPNVRWEDVGGLDEAQMRLREGVELPLRSPQSFKRMGIRPAKGFLLFGPPGTGKTLLAKAVAREAEANFVATKSSDLLSKWYGESEQQVSRLFERARQVAPTVVFIDEIDSLAPARGGGLGEPAVTERVVNTLLAEMDGLEDMQGVVVMAATNRPNLLDPALLRPGRFDELVYVPVPDAKARRKILGIHTKKMPLAGDIDLDDLAEKTERFTGADLEDLTRRAGLIALRQSLDASTVTNEDFTRALQEVRPSVTPEMEREYEEMLRTLRQENPQRMQIGFTARRQAAE
ncbi:MULTISPECIES: CDC48 family AAA ATPase [unclassified Rhizobium]|uniref:CDC48 family AAA ATPase n=1 Tax=unclassified Rhizobium TaxID=2613769 RepID=UPI00160BA261|nr:MULTISPECIES: CDC48 family AAA ATPase [unclassified Rhizobium]MBB3542243.1 transitional endoplasmic reticulum ATPase [Rhizobium sp. BK399]MCS3738102.1 transitional endoplasmic reticulum ATPase [Rhizobium sp. BK661]MCS4092950.1 transitional endoplasmic reticulum ATPase [Rhizobium sp. BK176]